MPVVDLNGKELKEKDLLILSEMITRYMENQIAQTERVKQEAENAGENPVESNRKLQAYQNGLNRLPGMLNAAKNGANPVKANEILAGISSGIAVASQKENAYRNNKKQTDEFFDKNVGTFKFVTEPIDWIEDVKEYDPAKERDSVLNNRRLKRPWDFMNTEEHLEKRKPGMNTGMEISRIHAVDMKEKKEVSFGDLYLTLTALNSSVMKDDEKGKGVRTMFFRRGGFTGVTPGMMPEFMYKTLTKVADLVNQVKQVEDPGLRKSRAMQVAAFSYQMLKAGRVFKDGNERTCTLFADTILQSFGLPPHVPTKEEAYAMQDLSSDLDFKKGTIELYKGVRTANAILQNEREKDIESAEQKKNKRHQLLAEVKKEITEEDEVIIRSDVYKNYIHAMEVLDTKMEELSRLDENGAEQGLSGEDRKDLLDQMTRVAETGELFLDTCRIAGKNMKQGVYGTINKLQNLISVDYDTVTKYTPEENRSLNELLEDSRTYTVDLRGQKLGSLGNMSSARIPMTVYGTDGKKRTGVFTKAAHVHVKSKFYDLLKEAAKGCNQTAVDEIMKIPESAKAFLISNKEKKADGSRVGNRTSLDYAIGRVLTTGYNVKETYDIETLPVDRVKSILRTYHVNVQRIPDKAMKVLAKGINKMVDDPTNQIFACDLELTEGSRLDQRNSAMSVVAGLLGAGTLLARSDSMRCIDKDGQVIEGTFMDFAKGVDMRNDVSLIRHIGDDPMGSDANKNKVIRQIADLQIIDYICLNTDRHEGNIMYQVDNEGHFTGIQAFDNDSSFGPRGQTLSAGRNLRVISRSMADKVNGTSPEMLRFALRGRGLTADEVNASVSRMEHLKDLMMTGELRTVEDDQFATLPAADMYPANPNYDNMIQRVIGFVERASEVRRQRRIRFEAYEERTPQLTKVSNTERQYIMGGLVDLTEKAGRMLTDDGSDLKLSNINSFGRRSNEFTAVLDALREVKNTPDALRERGIMNEDKFINDPTSLETKQALKASFDNLKAKVRIYLRKKTNERGLDQKGRIKAKNTYEKNRIAYVTKVLNLVNEYELREHGPLWKSGKLEREALMKRHDQNQKNMAKAM